MTGRGTANVLTRTTALLAVGFFITSLALSWLAGLGRHPASIINTGGGAPTSQEAPVGAPSSAPPLSQTGRGVLDQLGGKPCRRQRRPGRKYRSRNRQRHAQSEHPGSLHDTAGGRFLAA